MCIIVSCVRVIRLKPTETLVIQKNTTKVMSDLFDMRRFTNMGVLVQTYIKQKEKNNVNMRICE